MVRPTLSNGDVWSDSLANSSGYPILDGTDAFGHGPKVVDDWLDDGSDQIKANFYGFYDRVKPASIPTTGLTLSYPAYSVALSNGTVASFSSSNLVLPNNASGFIYLTASGALQAGTSLPAEGLKLASYTTASGNITIYTDLRHQAIEQIGPISLPNIGLSIGDIKTSARATPEAGWLLCDGSSYPISSYPALHSAIGTNYNLSGDPLGTFRVPDMVGRVAAGAGAGKAIATKAGAESQSLTIAQMPRHGHALNELPHNHSVSNVPHSHPIIDNGHSHIATVPPHTHSTTDPGHFHNLNNYKTAALNDDSSDGAGAETSTQGTGPSLITNRVETGLRINNASLNVSIATAASNLSVGSAAQNTTVAFATTGAVIERTGESQPISMLQPTIFMNYFIKAL